MGAHNKGDAALKSLGGDPVNIANLLLGARQTTTTEQINVGSITIVDDDSKFCRLFNEASGSQQSNNGRKILAVARQNNNQGDHFSNLSTKQLGIFKNRNS